MAEKAQLSQKAGNYLDQLYKARSDAHWAELPELARKVEKHAPWKKCLATAARTEAAFEQAIGARVRGGSKPTGIGQAIDTVLLSIKESKATAEEVFQARTTISWLHWIDGEYDQAVICIAPDAVATIEAENAGKLVPWTDICIVKSAFVRGASQEAKGRVQEALAIYQEVVARILSSHSAAKGSVQYNFWVERLLNRYARIVEPGGESGNASDDTLVHALEAFRAWAKVGPIERLASGLTAGGLHMEDRLSRRATWISYYKLLSSIAKRLAVTKTKNANARVRDISMPTPLDLCAEIQRVETTYDALLIKEVAFPEAHQYNHEVDEWTDLAMTNWAVFVGPAWPPEDAPQGGKRGLSQRMLDILYRGATRTFHSMTILRHLSTVHASLGEFDLAFRALASYVTIGTKAKARIQKSGELEPGVDSDDIFVSAIAAGIETLCAFGHRKEATRAQELATLLQEMLNEEPSSKKPVKSRNPQQDDEEHLAEHKIRVAIHSKTFAVAHRAIGVSLARWSFLTFEPAQRADLQQNALRHLRKSLQGSPGNERNLEALYALSLVAAESLEVQGATAAVKQALLQCMVPEVDNQTVADDTKMQTGLPSTSVIRCWHLLTLLLSSRQDYDNAADSCDEGLELIHKVIASSRSLDTSEKRSVISLRMTRIALKELLEGSDAAVNDSTTLLGLYGEMFKAKPGEDIKEVKETKPSGLLAAPAATPGRTLSLRLHRGKAERASRRYSDSSTHNAPTLKLPDEPEDTTRPTTSRSHRSPSRSGSKRLQKRTSKRSIHKPAALKQPTTEGGTTATNAGNVNESAVSGAPPHLAPVAAGNNLQSEVGLAITSDQNAGEGATLPENEEPRMTAMRSLTIHYFSTDEARKAQETLVEIWVFIAGLYRRAQLFSDAASACIEALKQVRTLESLVAAIKGTATEFAKPGWGGSKSVEELRADVLAEQGSLKLAISEPREAKQDFESALTHFADHVAATVGLSNLLLDEYENGTPTDGVLPPQTNAEGTLNGATVSKPVLATVPGVSATPISGDGVADGDDDGDAVGKTSKREGRSHTSPDALDRLTARDRAYNLLTGLSKLGTGWDQSEVWYALARAYELSGQLDKAQEALWWVVELESKRPIRHWGCLGQGYSLWY